MALIVMVVIFVMCMFLWFLGLIGAQSDLKEKSNWLAFIAVLILGVTVYLMGSGIIVWHHGP